VRHWDDLDEDILVPALLLGVGDRSRSEQHETAVVRDRKAES
jgi:hypothetical protein